MPTEAPFIPPKKKLNIIWWIGGAILLLVCLFLFQLIGPSPSIIISKQTTYITDPLLPSGNPNYEEYIRGKLREGFTPENNAAVLLFEALWPSELDPGQYKAVVRELGLKEIPSAEFAMKSPHGDANRKRVADWMPQPSQDDLDRGLSAEPDLVINAAAEHPWTSAQIPPLAAWVKENEAPLDLIVEASRRPRYYSPSPTLIDDQHDMLISMMLPGVQAVRDGVRGLNLRAMQHIGENRQDKAWQDVLAMYRLSNLVAQGSTLVEQLVAIAIRSIAFRATDALLSSEQLPKELAQQIQKDLDAIPPLANVATCVDQMERLCGLDAIIHLKMHGLSQLSALTDGGNTERSPVDFLSVDWNVALRKLNQAYDEATAAMKLPPGDERQQALARFESNMVTDQSSVKQPSRLFAAIISRSARSDVAGSIIQGLMLPALTAAVAAEERTNSMLSLAKVEAALTVYRAEHGAYPEKLDELVPGTLAKFPVDIFHGKPLVYKRVDQGYLLYSLGLNAQDDGGSNSRMNTFQGQSLENLDPSEAEKLRAKIPNGADDFSIRLPVSPFEMPKPRTE